MAHSAADDPRVQEARRRITSFPAEAVLAGMNVGEVTAWAARIHRAALMLDAYFRDSEAGAELHAGDSLASGTAAEATARQGAPGDPMGLVSGNASVLIRAMSAWASLDRAVARGAADTAVTAITVMIRELDAMRASVIAEIRRQDEAGSP